MLQVCWMAKNMTEKTGAPQPGSVCMGLSLGTLPAVLWVGFYFPVLIWYLTALPSPVLIKKPSFNK